MAMWVACSLGASACTVGSVDLTGKACPCVAGWSCDLDTNTCRRPSDPSSGTAGPSTSGPELPTGSSSVATVGADASAGDETIGVPGAFDVIEFSADWSTPNAIHWTWAVEGEAEDHHAWQVRVATSVEALDAGEGLVFDGDVNPELDRFSLRNTSGEEPVTGTITDGLTEDTGYFARLWVLDTAGGTSSSPNVAVRSTGMSPTGGEAIFSDAYPFPPGLSMPDCYTHTDTAPYGGSTHQFELHHRCDAEGVATCTEQPEATPDCWENLRLQGMNIPVIGLDVGDFPDAYVEVYVAVVNAPGTTSPGHGWWSELSVLASGEQWRYGGLTIRADGEYRRYQIPLTELGLSHRALASVVQGVRVGSTWQHGSVIRVDEAWIRW